VARGRLFRRELVLAHVHERHHERDVDLRARQWLTFTVVHIDAELRVAIGTRLLWVKRQVDTPWRLAFDTLGDDRFWLRYFETCLVLHLRALIAAREREDKDDDEREEGSHGLMV